MIENPVIRDSLELIFQNIAERNSSVKVEFCEFAWDTFTKSIVALGEPTKSLLAFNYFQLDTFIKKNATFYAWRPTALLLQQCSLTFDQEQYEVGITVVLSKQKVIKNIDRDELNLFSLKEDSIWILLQLIFKEIKNSLKNKEFFELDLSFFGVIRIANRVFTHHSFADNVVRIKKLVTPRRKNSGMRISKTLKFKVEDDQLLSESLIQESKKRKLSPLHPVTVTKAINLLNLQIGDQTQNKTKSLLNKFATPNVSISNDLLGAGIDPLKFDYNYSKLVNDTEKLFNKTFTKPKPAKIRHPGVIDKFERTTGVPQLGLKVSNSIILRIGANYNKYCRHIYTDIKQKKILFVLKQPKIAFTHSLHFKSATEEQEYRYVVTGHPSLAEKVAHRVSMYDRYMKYIKSYIGNENVSPLTRKTIEAIIAHVNVKQFKKSGVDAIAIMDKAMNEANVCYYNAYKKSIFDYILKDDREKERTGIDVIFNPPKEWGESKNKGRFIEISPDGKESREKAVKILSEHLYYPHCILEISELNLKIREIDLFRVKNNESKPVNVLYFIKKQNTHIADIMSYLSSEWIKNVGEIVKKHISIKNETQKKLGSFLKLVNVMLSNTLKIVVHNSFKKFTSFFQRFSPSSTTHQSQILQISMIDENGQFELSDNFQKILTEEISNLIRGILEESSKIHGIQFYLKEESSSYLWSIEENDALYQNSLNEIISVINENCLEINKFKQQFKQYQIVFRCREQIHQWLKTSRSSAQIQQKICEINQHHDLIESIPYSYENKMILVECFEEKQKLKGYLNNLKSQLYQHLENLVKKSNLKSFAEIQEIKRIISSPIQNTSDYLTISTDLQLIKKQRIRILVTEMAENAKSLLKLHELGYGFVQAEIIQKIYMTNLAQKNLKSKIDYHQERLTREKVILENALHEKIRFFQANTSSQLTTVGAKIDQFQIRRLFNDYLIEMKNFKAMVDDNEETITELMRQQEDLKWKKTKFKSAEELKNLVIPNCELWQLVLEYDYMMKQWKNQEISQMDVKQVKKRVEEINVKISKTIKKLKNLSSLKIAYEVQADTKEILSQQIPIIQTFSHPGLKERHWQLFNTKLMIPGVDLKDIPYSKIKIFYEYEKSLKILSVISNQAAKEFEIESEKNEQQQYWASVNFETYTSKIDNSFCVSQKFLSKSLSILDEHTNKLAVMKNYLYSKTLYQQLQEWEVWLASSYKVIDNIRIIQTELELIKPIFSYEAIVKQLPIEHSQFESIDGGWKSITKKIWEHPKIVEFMKSSKVSEMVEELVKKIESVKKGIPVFLMAKRKEFPRFYYLQDKKLLQILVKGAHPTGEKEALDIAFASCFPSSLTLVHNDDKFIEIHSPLDKLPLIGDIYQIKAKKKFFETVNLLEKCIRESIRDQISNIIDVSFYQQYSDVVSKNSLTAIFTFLNIRFTNEIAEIINDPTFYQSLMQMKSEIIMNLASLGKQEETLKIERIIVGILGQIEKLQKLHRLQAITFESYEYLALLKFKVSLFEPLEALHQQQNQSTKENKEINKTISQNKLEKACNKISKMRKHSIRKSRQNGNVTIQILAKEIKYEEEYWGSQASNYIPSYSERAIVNYFHNLSADKVNVIEGSEGLICVKSLAIVLGKFVKEISAPWFRTPNGFNSVLHGIICSGHWMVINCSEVGFQNEHYEKINNIASELKQKKNLQNLKKVTPNFLSPNSAPQNEASLPQSIYIPTFSEMCQINHASACFLISKPASNFSKIPASFRSQMRSVSLCLPQIHKITKSTMLQTIKTAFHQNKLLQICALTQLTFLYQMPSSVEKCFHSAAVELNRFSKEISNNCELINEIVHREYRAENQEKMMKILKQEGMIESVSTIKSGNQQIHSNVSLKSNISSSCLIKQQISKYSDCLIEMLNSPTSLTVLHGNFDIKTKTVGQSIKSIKNPFAQIEREFYSFPIDCIKTHTSEFFEKTVKNLLSKVIALSSLQKNIRSRDQLNMESNSIKKHKIYIHLQHESELEQNFIGQIFQIIRSLEFEEIIFPEKPDRYKVQISVICDCLSIQNLSPMTVIEVGKICMDVQETMSIGGYYQNWISERLKIDRNRSEDSRVNYQSVLYHLKTLEPILETILNSTMKLLSSRIAHISTIFTKLKLTKNFLTMFQIYLDHLDSHQIDEYLEFNVESYINNSFVYCAYWTFCMGELLPHEHSVIEQALIKEHFPEINDIQCISKYMLNEENEWLSWNSLKEEFGIATDIKSGPIYNVWVSTQQNMKLYTNVIKMLEKNISINLIGERCSGKSTLLKELSNFEISYSCFLIDCNRFTQVRQVSEVIKNRVYYTKNERKLILIDDLCLPKQEKSIGQIIKKILEEQHLSCQFNSMRPLFVNRSIDQPSVLFTSSHEQTNSVHLLQNCTFRILIKQYTQSQKSTIFKAYITYQLDRLKISDKLSNVDDNLCKFISAISKKFSINLHSSHKIIKLIIARLNGKCSRNLTENQMEKYSIEPNEFYGIVNLSTFLVLSSRKDYETIAKFAYEENNKRFTQCRNFSSFETVIERELLSKLPQQLELEDRDSTVTECYLQLGKEIERFVAEKEDPTVFISSSFHTEMILKIFTVLQVNPCHILILTENSYGIRTIMKMVTLLMGLIFNEVQKQRVDNFITDCINTIKVGGKIDESICYISNDEAQNIENSEILSIVNSFVGSPELHQFFTEQRIEQIFVKFSSEKKTLKRSEFIRKVREKINILFHFTLTVNKENYRKIEQIYPNLINQSFVIPIDRYPQEALLQIGKSTLNEPNDSNLNAQTKEKVIKALIAIERKIVSVFSDISVKYKKNRVFQLFQIFKTLLKKYQQISKQSETNMDIWESRIKQSEKKFEALQQQKSCLMEQNQQYFKNQHIYQSEVENKGLKLGKICEQIKNIENQKNSILDKIKSFKIMKDSSLHLEPEFDRMILIEQEMNAEDHKEFENLYHSKNLQSIMKILIGNQDETFDLDCKTNILENMENLRWYKKTKMDYLIDEVMNQLSREADPQLQPVKSLLEYKFTEWLEELRKFVNKINSLEESICEEESRLFKVQSKKIPLEQEKQSLEINLQQLKSQFASKFPDNTKTMTNFEEVSKAASQAESILKILQHFKNAIKFRNQRTKKNETVDISKFLGPLIYTAALIYFNFYIPEKKEGSFKSLVRETVKQNLFSVSEDLMLNNLLTKEEQFKNKYIIINNTDEHVISQICLSNNVCSVMAIKDEEEIMDLFQWLEIVNERKVTIVSNDEISMIRENLSNGNISLLVSPSNSTIKKLKPLINNDGEIKNNSIFVNLGEQTMINPNSKVIFVYTASEISRGKLDLAFFPNLWYIKFPGSQPNQQTGIKKLKKLIRQQKTAKSDLINEFSKKSEQLAAIHRKIENLILLIRKNNDNPDSIIIKIEAISEQKQRLVLRIEQILEQLDTIESSANSPDEIELDNCANTLYQIITSHQEKYSAFKMNETIKFLKIMVATNPKISYQQIVEKMQIHHNLSLKIVVNCQSTKQRQGSDQMTSLMRLSSNLKNLQYSQGLHCRSPQWEQFFKFVYNEKEMENTKRKKSLIRNSPLGSTKEEKKFKLVIYRTENMKIMIKYLLGCVESNASVEWRDITSLNQYALAPSVTEKIIAVAVNHETEWKQIRDFISHHKQKSQFNQLFIISANHIEIPPKFKNEALIIESCNQAWDLGQFYYKNVNFCPSNLEEAVQKILVDFSLPNTLIERAQCQQLFLQIKNCPFQQQQKYKYLINLLHRNSLT